MQPGGNGAPGRTTVRWSRRQVVVVAAVLVAAVGVVLVVVSDGDQDADPVPPTSREAIRAGLRQVPTGDPVEVTRYLDGADGAVLAEMAATGRVLLSAEAGQVCARLPDPADLPTPEDMLRAAVGMPDEALADGYAALRSTLHQVGHACADDERPDQAALDRLGLVMVGIDERLAQMGVEE